MSGHSYVQWKDRHGAHAGCEPGRGDDRSDQEYGHPAGRPQDRRRSPQPLLRYGRDGVEPSPEIVRRGESIMTNEYPPICIVSPSEFAPGTAQTSGSVRLAAIAPQLFVQSAMWGGLLKVEPGARTGIHHHGEQQTVAYVLSGTCDVRWGAKGEHTARAYAGDFVHYLPFYRTWRSIHRKPSPLSGWSSGAPRHRSL
jgi:uncharacterized RmlC-like cupin family protein